MKLAPLGHRMRPLKAISSPDLAQTAAKPQVQPRPDGSVVGSDRRELTNTRDL
jgi:hypothetical protein